MNRGQESLSGHIHLSLPDSLGYSLANQFSALNTQGQQAINYVARRYWKKLMKRITQKIHFGKKTGGKKKEPGAKKVVRHRYPSVIESENHRITYLV